MLERLEPRILLSGDVPAGDAPEPPQQPQQATESFVLGDADRDGRITGFDASLAAKATVGLIDKFEDWPNKEPVKVADIDQDGLLTGLDVSLIARTAVGLREPVVVENQTKDQSIASVDGNIDEAQIMASFTSQPREVDSSEWKSDLPDLDDGSDTDQAIISQGFAKPI